MRELKFRYKIKGQKKLLYDSDENFGYLRKDRKVIALIDGSFAFVEDEMQFTGAKDKAGTKVYKGDFVVHTFPNIFNYNPLKSLAVVEWDKDKTQFCLTTRFKNLRGFFKDEKYNLGTQLKPKSLKVIGNIYENPERVEEHNANLGRTRRKIRKRTDDRD